MRGVLCYLVLWRGYTSADDTWLRLDQLVHCQEKVADYDTAAPHRRTARSIARGADPAPVPTPPPPDVPVPAPLWHPPPGRRVPDRGPLLSEVLAGAAHVGKAILYLWPAEGWVRGMRAGSSSQRTPRRCRPIPPPPDAPVPAPAPSWHPPGSGPGSLPLLSEVLAGAALVRKAISYLWPAEG